MNKQEFIRDLNLQAGKNSTKKCLVMLIESELPASVEVSTDKNLDNVIEKMREYASENKTGNMGCCPPDKALEIAFSVLGINTGAPASGGDVDILSLL